MRITSVGKYVPGQMGLKDRHPLRREVVNGILQQLKCQGSLIRHKNLVIIIN
jgi:hypothetical protein